MRKHIALLLAVLSAAPQAGAQTIEAALSELHPAMQAAAQRGEAAKDADCKVCWDSTFTPLNEKAKTVKAWEDKKSEVSAAKAVTGVVGIFAITLIFTPRALQAAHESAEKAAQAKRELDALRTKAIALGGLGVKDGVVTKIELVKGVDYTVAGQ